LRCSHNLSIGVTIGVCVKNSERTIKEALESIISQKFPKELIQLIIVDGCSKDKTLSIVASMTAKTTMNVELYSDGRRGLPAARQMVVSKAKSKYIIFVDADVKLFNNFIENHVTFMEETPSVSVAFGKPMYQEGTLVSSVWNLYQYTTGGFAGNDATIYCSEALRQVGGFDLKMRGAGEDTNLIYRIQGKGWSVSVNEKARFYHENRANLLDFCNERSWFGYGGHYVYHNNKNVAPLWYNIPIRAFVYGFKIARKAYELTTLKKSFLIPVQMTLGNVFWWFGFTKGHLDGYGH
jgi:glycosyltransferase involved in cell wall biosynthesis